MSLFFGLDPQWQSHLLEFFIFKHCLWWTLQRWWKQCTWLHITKMPLAFNAKPRLVVFAQTHYAHSPTINLMCPKRQKCHHRNHRRRGLSNLSQLTSHNAASYLSLSSIIHPYIPAIISTYQGHFGPKTIKIVVQSHVSFFLPFFLS